MNKTKILGKAVGIQYRGLQDRSTQPINGLGSALLVGRFKRGRTDKPTTVHQGNIRAELGYEPSNPDYMAVHDMLQENVPSVNVLRIGV